MKVIKIFYLDWLGLSRCNTIESDSVNRALKLFCYENFIKKKKNLKIQYVTSNGIDVPDSYVEKLINEYANKKRKGKR